MSDHVLLVDDDTRLAGMVAAYIEKAAFRQGRF